MSRIEPGVSGFLTGRRGGTICNLSFAKLYNLVRDRFAYMGKSYDPDAVAQQFCVEAEKAMGIFPNIEDDMTPLGGWPTKPKDGNFLTLKAAADLLGHEVIKQGGLGIIGVGEWRQVFFGGSKSPVGFMFEAIKPVQREVKFKKDDVLTHDTTDIHFQTAPVSFIGAMLQHTGNKKLYVVTDVCWLGATDEWGFTVRAHGETVNVTRPTSHLFGKRDNGETRYIWKELKA